MNKDNNESSNIINTHKNLLVTKLLTPIILLAKDILDRIMFCLCRVGVIRSHFLENAFTYCYSSELIYKTLTRLSAFLAVCRVPMELMAFSSGTPDVGSAEKSLCPLLLFLLSPLPHLVSYWLRYKIRPVSLIAFQVGKGDL